MFRLIFNIDRQFSSKALIFSLYLFFVCLFLFFFLFTFFFFYICLRYTGMTKTWVWFFCFCIFTFPFTDFVITLRADVRRAYSCGLMNVGRNVNRRCCCIQLCRQEDRMHLFENSYFSFFPFLSFCCLPLPLYNLYVKTFRLKMQEIAVNVVRKVVLIESFDLLTGA